MHSNLNPIVIENGHARPFLMRSIELWNFQNRLGPGPREALLLKLLIITPIGMESGAMMRSMMKQIRV